MHDKSLSAAQQKDRNDALAHHKSAFILPQDIIYLDGNSLGALPRQSAEQLQSAILTQWGEGLIRSWNDAGWIDLPRRIGAKIAPLIGADAANVVMADSTSVNLFKLLSAACALRPDRTKIITEAANFPTDNYIAEGVINQQGMGHELVYAKNPDEIYTLIDNSTAVVMLTHINYRNGFMHDIEALSRAAHDAGALIIWDLAHSAGAVPVQLDAWNVDFAVGCSYKYLNGGPGAPAFLYVADRHLSTTRQPLSGWFSHHSPFAFETHYEPAGTIDQFLCGTPAILSAVALDAALDIWRDVDIHAVRAKSLALTDYFISLMRSRCSGYGLQLITPREHHHRGSHVSFTHPDSGYAIMSALISQGVIGDFRAPDILRFGFTPLYTSFSDVWHATDRLATLLEDKSWDTPQFHNRKLVT